MILLSTKNIVPRAYGEGSLGIPEKPWGHIYANNIPLTDTKINEHNELATAHPNGIAGNAATATKASLATDVGDGSSMWIHPQSSDEVNFGGTGGTTIYFGHRDIGSRAKPTAYYFGGTAASATVKAATFIGSLSGNASSASSATSASTLAVNNSANLNGCL